MQTRAQAKEIYSMASTPDDLRELCKHDLFFLLVHGMGRTDADNDFIFDRCREVQAKPNGYLDLWAREHYKSTIITVALTIQDILNDPNITVGIFSHTRPIAKAFLRQIKREFETNVLLQDLFPHIRKPEGKSDRTWSEDGGLIVVRDKNPKEATIEAWGLVDGQPTGKHFSLLVYDDVVTRESVTTPDMIAKVTDAWALSLNLGAHGGSVRYIGTRYHFNDTYKTILERKAAIPRIYAATINGKVEGEPLFLSRESLDKKRREMGAYVFGCQMLQDPKADRAQGFIREWFKTTVSEMNWHSMNRYIIVDPASSKSKKSDYTVMWVIGLGIDQNYYVIDCVRDRLNLTERARKLFELHQKYTPLAVGYEKYGQQADIEHIQSEMERRSYHFHITELGGQVPKEERIRKLIPLFEYGRIYFPHRLIYVDVEGKARDMTQEFLQEEFEAFPVSAHDDMLDGLARIVEPDLGGFFPSARPTCTKVVDNYKLYD